MILLIEEILHHVIGSSSHYLQGFLHPRWCKISSINSSAVFGLVVCVLRQVGIPTCTDSRSKSFVLMLFAPMLCVYVLIEYIGWYGPTCQHVLTLATLYLSFVLWYRLMYIKLLLLTNRYQAMSWQSMFLRGHSYLESDSIGLFGRNIMAAYLFVVIFVEPWFQAGKPDS